MKANAFRWFLCVLACASCGQDSDLIALFGRSPGKVALIFPENNSECTEGIILSDEQSEVTFRWEASVYTTDYEVRLANLAEGTVEILESDTNQLPITLSRATPYSWYVVSKNSENNKSAQSDTWSFYNAGSGPVSHIPFPAEAVSPENGAVIPASQASITLDWEASDLDGDLVAYDLYFGMASPPQLYQVQLTEDEYPEIAISPGTTYYWMVVCRDAIGNESNSVQFSFSVQEVP